MEVTESNNAVDGQTKPEEHEELRDNRKGKMSFELVPGLICSTGPKGQAGARGGELINGSVLPKWDNFVELAQQYFYPLLIKISTEP